jgi:hemolysin activation/secretion protein
LGDVVSTFGEVHGEAAYYQPIDILSTPTLALHVGGKKVWSDTAGAIPYHEAAYIGGSRSVRGYPQQRFAGDASTYGAAELRVPLSRIYIFVPGNLGIFGLYDIGRVYLEGDTSDSWHSSYGGGLWATFINTANTASLAIAASEEDTRLYLLAGFAF